MRTSKYMPRHHEKICYGETFKSERAFNTAISGLDAIRNFKTYKTRSYVFKVAHQISKAGSRTISESLKLCWAAYRVEGV